jgi:hypothetical protein
MSNQERGRLKRALAGCLVTCVVLLPTQVAAQVGHAPESSPYRNLSGNKWFSLFGGYLGGSAGSAGVGPTDGTTIGVRADFGLTAAIDLTASFAGADLGRQPINPTQGPAERLLDPARQLVLLIDGGIVLRLSGHKTWHGMLPYAGLTMGVAIGTKVDADSMSGFDFGLHFQTAPQIGIRVHPTRRLFFRLEARDVLWRLKYPTVFFEIPANDPDSPPVLDPLTEDDSEWTHPPMFMLGLGFRF